MAAALDAIDQSRALLTNLDCRLELGRSMAQRGKLHKSQGEDDAARKDWQQAVDLFGQIGAIVDERNTEQLLA